MSEHLAQVRYIAVRTSNPDEVRHYLYDHTHVLSQGTFWLILKTESHAADYHARYQADRLSSGWHGASVHESERDAIDRLEEVLGPLSV